MPWEMTTLFGIILIPSRALEDTRARVRQQLNLLHPGIKRFVNPHEYPAGLELSLHDLKTKLVLAARGEKPVS